jgi:low affinity Fe/Cu permease
MEAKSNSHFLVLEAFAQFGVRIVGRVASVCLAMFLIAAWMLTGPLFRLSDLWRADFKQRKITR